MPAILLFLGCLAIVLVLAIPSVARAATATPPASVVPMLNGDHLKKAELLFIKGEISLSPSSKLVKFWKPDCDNLVVTMRKAGGEQIAETHAMPSATPGQCTYSFKAPPAGEMVLIGLRPVGFKTDKPQPTMKLLKLDPKIGCASTDKSPAMLKGIYIKMQGSAEYAKLVPAVNGDIWIKGESHTVKLVPGQGATVPLFVNVQDSSGKSY
jgi:hypothetical protein